MDFSGLKASFGKFELNKNQAGTIYNIEIEKIRPNPNQPRKDFDDGELLELAEDMKRNGLIQPIVVRPDAENPGMFIIVTGERRYRAAKLNSDARIKAVVNEDWKDDEIGYVQMSENLQRSDLKFWELADFIIAHADAGEKQSEIAKKLGVSKSRVSQYMKWKEIPDYVKAGRSKIKDILTAMELAKMPEDEAKQLLDATPDGEFVSRSQASKALKPEETPAAPASDTTTESSGETAGTEAESFTSEPDSGSSEAPEGTAESFTEPSQDTGTGDSGSSDFSFTEGSQDSSDSGSGETEFTGDSSSSGSSESFDESSGTEESFTSETDSGSTESAAESFTESSDSGTADSGSSSDDSFFSEGSSETSDSSESASGETDSGSDSNSFAFDLDKPADDEFKKPIIYGSVDGREAELLWKKKPQTDGWVVVKYEDGTTEEVLAERYKLNRIYEIN